MARRQPRLPGTRDRIIESATTLLTRHGYAAVTVDEIAAGAGVTKGAFYHWFTDKADVARDVRHVLFDRTTTRSLRTLDPDADTLTAMKAGFEQFLDALTELGDARQFLVETWRMTADDEGPFDQEDAVDLVEGMLRAAQQSGEVADIDPTATAVFFVGGCSELALHVLETGQRDQAVAAVGRYLGALRARPDRRRGSPGRSRTALP